ncbi:MAG: isoprenylcysteine carboxylmethyltransferase family protein [Mogibacterium sp.]|jgi:protein-S-isoprenylcysteine O-methyltransferase Ste14|nr:isoprenylcysteine carboxylmethyltransferase family protein [Mogibacterium sp.]
MKTVRDIAGYLIGLLLFVIMIPLLMWRLSGNVHPGAAVIICFAVLAAAGIGLSVWSIIYMKNVGKGNPMDAFNHEVAPRTVNLMTDGPYRICRNPMLLGVFIYYIGLLICLQSWKAAVVFVAFFAVMMLQVNREEKRLKEDFGEAYIDYCKKTKKLIPYIW